MGDNDSKNDARRICFIEAKRKVLEKAGTYIESHTQIKNYQLIKDEITTYSAALLNVETVKEEWKFVGQNMAIDILVKAKVDTSKIENQLSKINQDKSVQYRIKEQQRKNVVFKEIESIQAKKIKITQRVQSRTRNVLEYVERGMTKDEVISLVGSPPSGERYHDQWRYGNVIIVFEDGAVGCIIDANVTTTIISCEYCRKFDRGSIIK
jgi:hypothetical protein